VSGRKIQPTFERLWYDCLQKESRTATRSEPTKEEHSALTSRFKGKKKVTSQKGSQKKSNTKGKFKGKSIDTSKIKSFSCNKLGHFARDCWYRKKNPRKEKHHASTAKDDESKGKQKSPSNEIENRKEYYLVSALSSTVITGPKTWLVDSGASKNMTGYKKILLDFKTKSFVEQVELGDDKCYKLEGVGTISFRLKSGARLHVDEVLYVPGLRKNLLSVATLEDKEF
jgi:DNA mismatch repair ATPase MutL